MPEPRDWIGTTQAVDDTLDPARAQALAATLDVPAPWHGDVLPPLWHWIYFWEPTPAHALGPDGHAARGGFLPPLDLPHRMWAGGRLDFRRPLRLGTTVRRTSTIADVREKQGRSGPLAFVTVRHEIADADDGLCLTEEQDIVYRGGAVAGRSGEPAPAEAAWSRTVTPGPVLLFRYSALTFNGHRIHYDHPYATETEGYPGLIVHGPLLATLLLDLLTREGGRPAPARFSFRALRPVFDTGAFSVHGKPGEAGAALWVRDGEGCVAMRGEAVS